MISETSAPWIRVFIAAAARVLTMYNHLPSPAAWLARVGSGLFLVVQMVILLDFAAAWNESWVSKDSDTWMYALLAVTVTCYAGSLVTVGLLFHWCAPRACAAPPSPPTWS